jgi:ankyrin repeat protein
MAQILLNNGAKFDEENTFGQKPVHVAAKHGHTELVELFVSHGAKADNVALYIMLQQEIKLKSSNIY